MNDDKENAPPSRADRLQHELDEAEAKAWDSLARYKFQMFGYWAAIWVHLNRIGGFKRPNPWKSLVHNAREQRRDKSFTDSCPLPPGRG